MALDTKKMDRVISPEFQQSAVRTDEVSIRTVRSVKTEGNFYEIVVQEGEYIPINRNLHPGLGDLKEGDGVIIIRNGRTIRLVYGPINNDHLYIPRPG